jgi:RNA polymerase sigma-70 factor (ECF subfamily)
MNHLEDKILVKGFLLSGSETLFRQLYRKHTLSVYRLALQLTNKDVAGTEDIIQEAWVRAVTKLAEFKWNSSFKTWLSGIVINCCREYLRKNKSGTIPYSDIEEEPFYKPANDKIDLRNALAMLPLGYREVLLLHDMEGYKHEEIGQLLGISEGTSKSQLFHARKAIQKLLN